MCPVTLQIFWTDTGWHKKTVNFEKPNKNLRNLRKKFIDRNWTITTCLLRDSNQNYKCLKITSCRWRPPPRMHSSLPLRISKVPVLLCHPVCVACSAECDSVAFIFKSSHFFVSLCIKIEVKYSVCCYGYEAWGKNVAYGRCVRKEWGIMRRLQETA